MQAFRERQAHAKPRGADIILSVRTRWPISSLNRSETGSTTTAALVQHKGSRMCGLTTKSGHLWISHKVNEMQGNATWRLWSSVWRQSGCTFIQIRVKSPAKNVPTSPILVLCTIRLLLLPEEIKSQKQMLHANNDVKQKRTSPTKQKCCTHTNSKVECFYENLHPWRGFPNIPKNLFLTKGQTSKEKKLRS